MKKIKGFTLIELLVVVAIISLLSSVVLASVRDAREKAQKSAFAQSIHEVQLALELYKTNNGHYPHENALVGGGYFSNFVIHGPYTYYDGITNELTNPSNGEEPFMPKYISKFPDPFMVGLSADEAPYNEISYFSAAEALSFGYVSCGSKPINGYVIDYFDYGELGIPLPNAITSNGSDPIHYCVTAN